MTETCDPSGPPPCPEHPSDGRHSRKCVVCRHPERETIEADFLDWHSPYAIGRQRELPPRSLYRHFQAAGLISRRRESLRVVLDRILERGAETPVTGDMIIRAVRAQCCLTNGNKWVEPTRQVVVTRQQPLIDTPAIRK